jgi:hypothetical protein
VQEQELLDMLALVVLVLVLELARVEAWVPRELQAS